MFRSLPLESYHAVIYLAARLIAGITLKNTSVGETDAIFIRNLGRLTLSRKTPSNVLKLDS